MVFQSYAIFPHLNVKENIAFGLRLKNLPRREIDERIATAADLVGLEELLSRQPSQLSGGQQQRVALARAIIMEPSVLLFDEPLSNLDAKLREQMRIDIRKLQQRLEITSIYVTHDQIEAMSISDRVVVMHQGRIEQTGPPRELYARPVNRFVASFIGKAAFLPSEKRSDESWTLLGNPGLRRRGGPSPGQIFRDDPSRGGEARFPKREGRSAFRGHPPLHLPGERRGIRSGRAGHRAPDGPHHQPFERNPSLRGRR
ncbi:hypothetical protein MASR2M17_18080 [Aminivibrio sp.]